MKLPISNQKTIARSLGKLARANAKLLTLTTASQLIASSLAVAVPALIGTLLDRITAGTTSEVITKGLWLLGALVLLNAVFTLLSEYLAVFLGERIFQQLRDGMMGKLIYLPLSKVESAGAGDMLGRVTRDVDNVAYIARRGVGSLIYITATLLVTLISAFLVSPILAPVMIFSLFGVTLLCKWYFPRAVPVYRADTALYAQYSGLVSENAAHARTIEALGLVPNRYKEIRANPASIFRLDKYGAYLRVFLIGGTDFLVLSPLILISVVGAWMSAHGLVTIGQVTAIAMYVLNLNSPIQNATFWVDVLQIAQASIARIFGVNEIPPDRTPTGITPTDRTWRIDGVNFAYGNGAEVLHDINLSIEPGERLAIVGTSGAGKSTLARLIAGFDEPSKGHVTVGHAPVRELKEVDLHRQVALITQEHHVFSASLEFNLKLVKPEATEAELWQALETVEAHWARHLENGLQTKLGNEDTQLSESQAQQLALARLVLMDPHTLILDEATSMMDPKSARQIERSLSKVLTGRTVIMIAHRLFTAQDADRICVMDDGKIIEVGSHQELIAKGGQYAQLWQSWQA